MRSRHHEELVFFGRQRTHCERAVAVKRAHQHIDAVVLNKLRRHFDGLIGVGRIVGLENGHWASQHTAFLIEQINRHVGPMNVVDGGGLIRTRQRIQMPILIGSSAYAIRTPKSMNVPRFIRPPNASAPPVTAVHCKKRLRDISCMMPASQVMFVRTVRTHDFIVYVLVSSVVA